MCDQLVLYVGQTIKTLNQRAWRHRSKSNDTASRHIPEYTDWEIKLLEECNDDVGTAREQYYYDILKPFYNVKRPGQTRSESQKGYMQTEKGKEAIKRYKQTEKGKEANRLSAKRYYAKQRALKLSVENGHLS